MRKKELFLLSLIFALALFFRLAYLADYKNSAVFPVLAESDSDFYYQRANDIACGDIFNSKAFLKWPLYAYLLAFLFRVSANNVLLVYMLQFLLGAATCVVLYFIAREPFNAAVGLIAALLYAWYGLFIFYEGLLIYTSLSLFLNALLFLLVLKIRDNPNAKNLFWLGLFLGICTITQGNIAVFGILAVFWLLWQRRTGFKKSISYFLCFCLGLGLIFSVLILRSRIVDKEAALFTGNTGLNFYIGNGPEADGLLVWPKNLSPTAAAMLRDARAIARLDLGRELKSSEVSAFWFNKAMDFIKKNPYAYFRLLLKKTGYLFSPQELIFEPEYPFIRGQIQVFKFMFMDLRIILPFAFLGMLLNLRNLKKTGLLYLILFALTFSIILFFVQAKFRIMLAPYLMIFAGCGIFALWESFRGKRLLRLACLSSALGILFILSYLAAGSQKQSGYAQDNFAKFHHHFSRAIAYEKDADYPSALNELNLAARIKPDNHNVIYSRGAIYYGMHKFDQAEEQFKRAIAISPFFVDAYYNLGFLYNQERKFDEAIAVLKKAAFLDPDDIGVGFELARSYRAKGMLNEAREELRLILKKARYRPLDKAVIEKELAALEK